MLQHWGSMEMIQSVRRPVLRLLKGFPCELVKTWLVPQILSVEVHSFKLQAQEQTQVLQENAHISNTPALNVGKHKTLEREWERSRGCLHLNVRRLMCAS